MANPSHARDLGLIAVVRDLQSHAAQRAVDVARSVCHARTEALGRANDTLGSAVDAWLSGMAAERFDPWMASIRSAEIAKSEAGLRAARDALTVAQNAEVDALQAFRLASARRDVAHDEAKRARRHEARLAEERWLLSLDDRSAAEHAA